MPNPLNNKVVAITGAGKGLGRAYAQYFAERGAAVVVNNRRHEGESESSADRVVDEIVSAGGKAVAEYSSVEEPAAGDKLLNCALEHYGCLDCLVANAGIIENRTFRKQTLGQFRDVLEINLMGTVNVVHPVFRHLCEHGGGNIIVSTSSAGLYGEFGLPAYSTAKAGLIGLTHALSLEGAPKNVYINAIAPYASTQMTAEHLSDEVNACFAPEHVAPVVAWLADCTVTGEVLIAGGGQIARAGVKTSHPIPTSEADGWQSILSSELDLNYDSGRQQFEALAASVARDDK